MIASVLLRIRGSSASSASSAVYSPDFQPQRALRNTEEFPAFRKKCIAADRKEKGRPKPPFLGNARLCLALQQHCQEREQHERFDQRQAKQQHSEYAAARAGI